LILFLIVTTPARVSVGVFYFTFNVCSGYFQPGDARLPAYSAFPLRQNFDAAVADPFRKLPRNEAALGKIPQILSTDIASVPEDIYGEIRMLTALIYLFNFIEFLKITAGNMDHRRGGMFDITVPVNDVSDFVVISIQ
jgi:hypothetical protein